MLTNDKEENNLIPLTSVVFSLSFSHVLNSVSTPAEAMCSHVPNIYNLSHTRSFPLDCEQIAMWLTDAAGLLTATIHTLHTGGVLLAPCSLLCCHACCSIAHLHTKLPLPPQNPPVGCEAPFPK